MIKNPGSQPKRVLNVFVLALLNVSMMASLRNLPLVAEYGLSAVFYYFIVAICFLIPSALVSAELATGWPKTGGVYIWVREGLGDRWGFMAIWMQWVHNVSWYPVILAFIATSLAYVFNPELATNKLFVLSVVLIGFWSMTLLNYLGIKTSSLFSAIGVILGTIAPGLLIIALGFIWWLNGNPIHISFTAQSLFPDVTEVGNLVFLTGLFLAFAGLEVSSAHAREVKDPQKNYPRSIILAAIITFFLFMLGALAISFVIPKEQINLASGLMEAFKVFFSHWNLEWILPIMGILLIIGAAAEVNAWIAGPVKGLYATSIHGNLPIVFHKVNQHDTPTNLLLFQAIIVSIAACVILFMPTISSAYWILSALSAQTYLVMYILMFIAAIRLRYVKSHVPRTYRIPFQHKGIWIAGGLGATASTLALLIAFIPPTQIQVGSTIFYDSFLITSFVLMCALPLIIYQCRKPTWFKKSEEK
ncbi:MAG: amino acid permease [Simkania sp.]|nr:amino acid permease [Simkania sp.]